VHVFDLLDFSIKIEMQKNGSEMPLEIVTATGEKEEKC
jgi:hypothetical protein